MRKVTPTYFSCRITPLTGKSMFEGLVRFSDGACPTTTGFTNDQTTGVVQGRSFFSIMQINASPESSPRNGRYRT